jgi:hypothetical protein
MRINVEREARIAPLLGGILEDFQNLVRQELALARAVIKSEVREGVEQGKRAGISLGLGLGFGLVSILFLSHMLVYLLNWIFPSLPLWLCFALFGVLTGGAAATLFLSGKTSITNIFTLERGESGRAYNA